MKLHTVGHGRCGQCGVFTDPRSLACELGNANPGKKVYNRPTYNLYRSEVLSKANSYHTGWPLTYEKRIFSSAAFYLCFVNNHM